MYIFIDESGIHKDVEHSVYVLVLVEVENYDFFNKSIIKLENELKIKEFHWAETIWRIKEQFINKALKLDFKIKVAVLNNPINPHIELERTLSHLLIENDMDGVYIDGKKPKWYERKIKSILRTKKFSIRKLKTVKSSQYPGIRIADMSAGLIRSFYDSKNLNKIEKYYRRLQKKIIITVK